MLFKFLCGSQPGPVKDFFFIYLALTFVATGLNAQQKKKIDIIKANSLEANQYIVPNAQRLIGDVVLKHNEVLISCDSAYSYTSTNKVDGFGHVHVNQGDTLHLYSDRVFYNGDINDVVRRIGEQKVSDVTIEEPTLEEIFMHYYE